MIIKNKMYVIGGNRLDTESKVMFRLDLSNWLWESVPVKGADGDQSHVPESLDEHSACMTSDESKIVTCAGFIGGSRTNSIHTYDVQSSTWEHIKPADD